MELNGTITENRVDLGGTITKTKALSGALAQTGGSAGPVVVTRGTGTNSLIEVHTTSPNIASEASSVAIGGGNQSIASGAVTIGTNNVASAQNAVAIGSKLAGADPNTASAPAATALGLSCEASGYGSVAVGYNTTSSNTGSFSSGYQTTSSGQASITAGYLSTASGTTSAAIGQEVTASATAAVAMGRETTASGAASTALGRGTTASASQALAAGRDTKAEAVAATALGYGTDATGARSLVAGAYNELDANEVDTTHGAGTRKYLMIIGNGTADTARSNAATLDWDGNAVFAGKATVGAAPTADMDVATKKYVDDNSSSITVDSALSSSSTNPVQNKVIKAALDAKGTYSKPSGGIPATDLASGVIPSVPSPASSGTPAMDGTAAVGTSTDYARADHVHPTDTSRAAVSDLAAKITAPSSPATGDFLVYNGTAWVAQSLSTWQGGNY